MSIDWNAIAQEWHDEQPHPDNPSLKVGEYATAVKLATRAKFGGHASPHEAGAFWREYQSMNERFVAQGKEPVSPEEFGHILDRVAPHSFAYHGRPPTMHELARHREAEPSTVAKYYGDLPDKDYPHVTARDMAKFVGIAEPFAHQHLGRGPNKLEGARFALAGLNASGIGDYYSAIKGGPPEGASSQPAVTSAAAGSAPAGQPPKPQEEGR